MWLVVGLGNPGQGYVGTRHNVGFAVAAELARRWQLPTAKRKFKALVTRGRIPDGGPEVTVLLPQTYMNESGKAVGPARGSLHVEMGRVLVIHDELDLQFGRVQARLGGGLAGHNGLKSVKAELGSAEFARVRVGIGRPAITNSPDVSAYVLGRFSQSSNDVQALVNRACDVAEQYIATAFSS